MATVAEGRKSTVTGDSMLIVQDIGAELCRVSLPEDQIAALGERYLALKIKDAKDKAGLDAVHKARMIVKNHRIAIDKRREELKADSIAYGRRIESEAKRLMGLLAPIEEHLLSEEKRVKDEEERIKREKMEAERLKAEAEARAAREAEEARIAAEREELERQRAAMRAEQERLDAIRREQDAAAHAERERLAEIERKQREESARIEAEKKRLADAENERQRQIELEEAKRTAAEKARAETEARLKREQEEAEKIRIEAERRVAEETARAEAMRPDVEKIQAFAGTLRAIQFPEVTSGECVRFLAEIKAELDLIAKQCEQYSCRAF